MSTKLLGIGVIVLAVSTASLGTVAATETAPATRANEEASATSTPELIPPQVLLDTQNPPKYPPAALEARYSGSVMLETTVLPDGSVGDVKVLECTRPKVGFEQAATKAVKKWRFEPGKVGDKPVEVTLKFRLAFRPEGVTLASGQNALPTGGGGSSTSDSSSSGAIPTK